MDALFENQEILVATIKVVVFIFVFLLVAVLGFYNWLYLSRILKSHDQIGFRPPKHVHHLVKTCILIPVFAAVFIAFFMILGIY